MASSAPSDMMKTSSGEKPRPVIELMGAAVPVPTYVPTSIIPGPALKAVQ